MTESSSTGSGGQSSVLCPDGLPVYREILRPHNAVIQSVHYFSPFIDPYIPTPPEAKKKKVTFYSVIPTSADVGRPGKVRSGSVYLSTDQPLVCIGLILFRPTNP